MNKEEFLNDIRREVGVPTIRTKASHTRKMTRRGLGVLAVIAISAMIVAGGLIVFFGQWTKPFAAQSSIKIDNLAEGTAVTFTSSDVFGGDVLQYNHNISNLASRSITVNKADMLRQQINGTWTNCTQNEITTTYWTQTPPTGTMNFGAEPHSLTRLANVYAMNWTSDSAGATLNGFTLVISDGQGHGFVKTWWDLASGQYHYSTWEGSAWSNAIALTQGVRDPTSGILWVRVDGNHLLCSISYAKLPLGSFTWGCKLDDNAGGLIAPTGWSGTDTDFTNMQADGFALTTLAFPLIVPSQTTIAFVVQYAVNSLIQPGTYQVKTTFNP